jgi:hypothetical protein
MRSLFVRMTAPVVVVSVVLLFVGVSTAWYVLRQQQDAAQILSLNVASIRAAEGERTDASLSQQSRVRRPVARAGRKRRPYCCYYRLRMRCRTLYPQITPSFGLNRTDLLCIAVRFWASGAKLPPQCFNFGAELQHFLHSVRLSRCHM